MLKRISILTVIVLFAHSAAAAETVVNLATSTSTVNSGLLEVLQPVFEKTSGLVLKTTAVGSGRALRLARQGAVDVLLVNAPEAENRFVFDGHGVDRRPVMFNYSVILGPADDPARVRDASEIKDAMTRIADSAAGFVSRADDSGTQKKRSVYGTMRRSNPMAPPGTVNKAPEWQIR